MNKSFTLIELPVVIAIIGLLSTIVLVSVGSVRAKGRDAKRIADLKALQQAVEMYQVENGSYPLGCRAGWSGHSPGYGDCDIDYIQNISSYISKLPIDPKWDSGDYGYLYRSDGNNYSILAHQTMETACDGSDLDSTRDPGDDCNPPEMQALDRTCCEQPSIWAGTINW